MVAVERPQIQAVERQAEPRLRSTRGPLYEAAVLGFRHYWYPAMLSRHLGKKPQRIKMLGEDLVFVRGEAGRPHALFDRCVHRGMPLSAGKCLSAGTITCAYHGWSFDVANGNLVAALTDGPESSVVGKVGKNVRAYPTEERNGIIYVYMGDNNPPPLEEDVPEEVLSPDYTFSIVVSLWKSNWRAGIENGMDAAHAPYIHRDSLRWRTNMRMVPAWGGYVESFVDGKYLIQKKPSTKGFEAEFPRVGRWPRHTKLRKALAKLGEREGRPPIQTNEFRLPCIIRNRYNYYRHVRWAVPVDANTSRTFQALAGPYDGARSAAFKAQYWLWHRWVFHMWFNGQDDQTIEQLDYDAPEQLFRPDSSVVGLRKYVEAHVRTTDPEPGVPEPDYSGERYP
jgi:phenylpropionate dioxygenase-like ring-hydroxylating dioxygenase large terminal subunit